MAQFSRGERPAPAKLWCMRQKGQKFSFTICKKREGRRWSLNLWVFPSTCQEQFGQRWWMSHQLKSDISSFVLVPKGSNSSPGQIDGSPSTDASVSWTGMVEAVEQLAWTACPSPCSLLCLLAPPLSGRTFSELSFWTFSTKSLEFLSLVPLHVCSLMCSWGKQWAVQCSSSYSLLPAYLTTHTVNISSKALSSHDNTVLSTKKPLNVFLARGTFPQFYCSIYGP